ncbi:MAG: hybrid sensor histidine kinase/response regulator [Myxococcota bacterium]
MLPALDSMQAETKRPKILVVDDHAENRALAKATLEDEDYEVLLAASGEEALSVFEREQPDCVLLDVRMPGMDGLVVCERIRAMPQGSETPVVFLTALRDVDTFDQALRAGGDDFLTKPVRPTELLVRVQAALKLRRMSDELRENYVLVRRQRDDLMRLQLQKERLMAFVVHDLKNPVNAMDLHAQLLLRDASLPPRVRESLQDIREEVRSLLRLVLNLLDISKSEEGQLSPRMADVDLAELCRGVLDAMQVKAKAANVTLEHSLGAQRVTADADLLRRVLENLLDNALRHAPENSVVRLISLRRDQGAEIRVQDAGSGIAEDMRQRIFERFVQIESGARIVTRSGRGLGLAFCKLAVEAHGGTIWIEDGKPGAVFCFSLPDRA